MSQTIEFYTNPMSRGRIVHWMLEEVGAPYVTTVLDFAKQEHKRPAFLKINPMGKLPAIVHRGTVVTETAAILAYLADAFPESGLAPSTDDPTRGTYLRWLFFGAACVEPALIDKMLARPPVEKKIALGYGSFDDTVAALETAVQPGPFVLGERFSAADVYLASQVGFGSMTKALSPSPVLKAYLERCVAREGWVRFNEKTVKMVEGAV